MEMLNSIRHLPAASPLQEQVDAVERANANTH